MPTPELLTLAIKNVLRSGTRTVLCVLAICIGITSVSIITGLGGAAGQSVQQELNQIGVRGVAFYTKTGESFSEDALQALAQSMDVSTYMPLALATGTVRLRNQRSNAGVLGVDENLGDVFQLTVLHGSLPTVQQVSSAAKVAVIDAAFAEKAYKRQNVVGKTMWLTVNGVSEKLEICGVIQSQSAGLSALFGGNLPCLIYLPHTTLTTMSSDIRTDKVITIPVHEENDLWLDKMTQSLERKTGRIYQYENLNQYIDRFASITGILTLLIGGVAVISVIVGGIGVMNAMVSAVDARRREIGVYRALGAKRRDIVCTFLAESVILCLIGGILGIGLNWIVLMLIKYLWSFAVIFQWKSILLGLAMAMICGVSFGWLPAIRAANLDPIQAIRAD